MAGVGFKTPASTLACSYLKKRPLPYFQHQESLVTTVHPLKLAPPPTFPPPSPSKPFCPLPPGLRNHAHDPPPHRHPHPPLPTSLPLSALLPDRNPLSLPALLQLPLRPNFRRLLHYHITTPAPDNPSHRRSRCSPASPAWPASRPLVFLRCSKARLHGHAQYPHERPESRKSLA